MNWTSTEELQKSAVGRSGTSPRTLILLVWRYSRVFEGSWCCTMDSSSLVGLHLRLHHRLGHRQNLPVVVQHIAARRAVARSQLCPKMDSRTKDHYCQLDRVSVHQNFASGMAVFL